MQFIKSSVELLYPTFEEGRQALLRLESAGRTCYKSEDKVSPESAPKFARMILGRKHESVLEHITASFRIICDRGVTHEIVRHRLASYSQESTRYVNYAKRFGIQFVHPNSAFEMDSQSIRIWAEAMEATEKAYNGLIERGMVPEMARSVLPNATKTEIVMTANIREWCHFCTLRCAPAAHPQMREVAKLILERLSEIWPEIFGDLAEKCL